MASPLGALTPAAMFTATTMPSPGATRRAPATAVCALEAEVAARETAIRSASICAAAAGVEFAARASSAVVICSPAVEMLADAWLEAALESSCAVSSVCCAVVRAAVSVAMVAASFFAAWSLASCLVAAVTAACARLTVSWCCWVLRVQFWRAAASWTFARAMDLRAAVSSAVVAPA